MTPSRTDTANAVLAIIAPGTSISLRDDKRAFVTFQAYDRKIKQRMPVCKQWMTRGQSFYPVWNRQFTHGGTVTTALANLVRWVLRKPVVPLSTWRYWVSDTVLLASVRGADVVETLKAGEYPDAVLCVLCGRKLEHFDWWHLNCVSGPPRQMRRLASRGVAAQERR